MLLINILTLHCFVNVIIYFAKAGEKMKPLKQMKMYNVEVVRFVFSLIIVYYHILHASIMNYTGGAHIYETLSANNKLGSLINVAFFMLSGYFLYQSYKAKPQRSVKEFAYYKVARLWPVLFFSFVIGIIFFNYGTYTSFFNSLFLQCIGISFDYQGITWFVSPMFWVLIFYFVLLKTFKDHKKLNVFIGVIVYFSFVYNLNATNGGFGRETVGGFINLGLLTALSCIGLGYLIGVCVDSFLSLDSVKNFQPSKLQSAVITLIISVLEAASFGFIVYFTAFSNKTYKNKFTFVIVFSLLLLCMISGKGILSRICNNKFLGGLGKYSYSIYIMQQISFYILQRTLWQNTDYVQHHAYRCLAISVAFSVLVGIVVYYVIEKPCAVAFKKFGKKLFAVKRTAEN